MKEPGANDYELITRALQGKLTDSERRELERRLESDPTLREAYELEQSVDHLLERLPNVVVSSNFTSLVVQAVHAEQRQKTRAKIPWLPFRFARLASGLAVVTVAGVLSVQHFRRSEQQEIARSIASFSQVASAMSPKEKPALVFRDFEAIQRLAAPADSELDLELLVALQK